MANEQRLDLIDRKALANNVYALYLNVTGMRNGKTLLNECMEKYRNEVLRTICKAPTVDAVEVVHARWIDVTEYCGDFMCSNCEALYGTNRFNYCPNCGAKMDGGNEDG